MIVNNIALTYILIYTQSDRVDCLPFIKLPGRIALPDQLSAPGGILSQFFRKVYAPFLSHPLVKGVVLASFGGIAVLSVITSQHIQLGLGRSRQDRENSSKTNNLYYCRPATGSTFRLLSCRVSSSRFLSSGEGLNNFPQLF